MGKHTQQRVVVAKSSGITVSTAGRGWFGGRPQFGARLRVLGLVFVALVLAAGVWALLAYRQHVHEQHAAEQHALQTSLADANHLGDTTKLKADSGNLIQGAADGSYDVSDKDLAQAHASRGDAELNAGNYKAAVADYQQAAKLDPAQQPLVAYGEFLGRYHLGERKTLVPLLQSLATPLQHNYEPQAQQQLERYNEYIADLQAGKDLDL